MPRLERVSASVVVIHDATDAELIKMSVQNLHWFLRRCDVNGHHRPSREQLTRWFGVRRESSDGRTAYVGSLAVRDEVAGVQTPGAPVVRHAVTDVQDLSPVQPEGGPS